ALGLMQRASRFGIDPQSRSLAELQILIAGRRTLREDDSESETLPPVFNALPGDEIISPDGSRRVIVLMDNDVCYFMKYRGDGTPGIDTLMGPQMDNFFFSGGEVFVPGTPGTVRLANEASEVFE